MRAYQLRYDEDGHTYLVPHEDIPEFDRLTNETEEAPYGSDYWHDAVSEFCNKFDSCRIDGYTSLVFYLP